MMVVAPQALIGLWKCYPDSTKYSLFLTAFNVSDNIYISCHMLALYL